MTPDEGMSDASGECHNLGETACRFEPAASFFVLKEDCVQLRKIKHVSFPFRLLTPLLVPSHPTDNYVTSTLTSQKHLPPITYKNLLKNINWVSFLALTVTPSLAIYGGMTTGFNWKTFWWS